MSRLDDALKEIDGLMKAAADAEEAQRARDLLLSERLSRISKGLLPACMQKLAQGLTSCGLEPFILQDSDFSTFSVKTHSQAKPLACITFAWPFHDRHWDKGDYKPSVMLAATNDAVLVCTNTYFKTSEFDVRGTLSLSNEVNQEELEDCFASALRHIVANQDDKV